MTGNDLDKALEDRGLISVTERLSPQQIDKWFENVHVVDNQSLYEWVVSSRRRYLEKQARHDLGIQILSEDVYDFILGRLHQLTEMHVNMRKIGYGS